MASSVVLIQGTEEFLVRRRIRELSKDHVKKGYEVRYFDAAVPSEAEGCRTANGMSLFGGPPQKILAIIRNPQKLDIDWVVDLMGRSDDSFAVILHVEGNLAKNTRLHKRVAVELKKRRLALQIDRPPPHKLEDRAVEFLQQEMVQEHHKYLDERLARAIVVRAGTDLGVLAFEAWKLALLESEDAVSVDAVRGSVSTLAKVEIKKLIDALTSRSAAKVLKVLDRMYETWSSDPTMAICGMLTPVLFRWSKAVAFDQMGIPPKAAAEIMNVNPWYWTNIVQPEAKKIGFRRIRKMIFAISETQKATRSGRLSPRIILETGFLSALEN